jgi:hypothetical protein
LTLLLLHSNGLHKEASVEIRSSFANSLTIFRRLNQQFIIYYRLQTKMRNIKLMRFGLWTRYNMVTLDSSMRMASELYVCSSEALHRVD